MRPLWKGAISFGLVNIPVGLYSGASSSKTIDLDMLRDSDLSRIRYKRMAEADGKEVPYEHIVKGYEYEKGNYVVLTPEDFTRVQLRSTQLIEIREFVNVADIETRYFDKPYYLAPEKTGAKAYAVLRDALTESGKVGLAKVVIRPPREHLCAVQPLDGVLTLETMHFADQMRNPDELGVQTPETGEKELEMACVLIKSLAAKWEPEKYRDEYQDALLGLIEEKVKAKGKLPPPVKAPAGKPAQVIDLVSVLQQSINEATGKAQPKRAKRAKSSRHRKAA